MGAPPRRHPNSTVRGAADCGIQGSSQGVVRTSLSVEAGRRPPLGWGRGGAIGWTSQRGVWARGGARGEIGLAPQGKPRPPLIPPLSCRSGQRSWVGVAGLGGFPWWAGMASSVRPVSLARLAWLACSASLAASGGFGGVGCLVGWFSGLLARWLLDLVAVPWIGCFWMLGLVGRLGGWPAWLDRLVGLVALVAWGAWLGTVCLSSLG